MVFTKKNKEKIKFFIFLILTGIFCNFSLFSKTVLDDNFTDFFPPEIFKKFPPSVLSFDFNKHFVDIPRPIFDCAGEADEKYEIKLAFRPSNLPFIKQLNSDNVQYKYKRDFSIRLFKSENSNIFIYISPEGILTKVFKDENFIKMCRYDKKDRVISEIMWKDGETKMYSQTKYVYDSKDKKVPSFALEKNYNDKLISKIFYTEKNFIKRKTVFNFLQSEEQKNSDNDNFDDELFIDSSFEDSFLSDKNFVSDEKYEYDEKNRILRTELTKGDFFVVHEYDFKKKLRNPDEVIYENNIKKSEKIFESDGNYSYEIYLPNNYSVKTVYKDYLIDEEIFFLNGEFVRSNKRGEL
ncbi:MAG: hypothetical protein ACTTHG_06965 [Treponemataceae bacterium]